MQTTTESKIAPDVVEHEFRRFAEFMDIDLDPISSEEIDTLATIRRVLFRAMGTGALTIDQKGQPTYRTSTGDDLTFPEPTGSTLVAIEKSKNEGGNQRLFRLTGELTGRPASYFEALPLRDLRVITRIMQLFLA